MKNKRSSQTPTHDESTSRIRRPVNPTLSAKGVRLVINLINEVANGRRSGVTFVWDPERECLVEIGSRKEIELMDRSSPSQKN